jgi:alpha-tubulin suppressor-like RCC1 family protein
VWCWGLGVDGELGDGTFNNRSTPVQVSNLAEVVQVSSGHSHTCARKRDGTVWCWGRNRTNNLGNGTTMNQPAPVLVTGLDDVAWISAGGEHSCAVKVDGTAWCWGLASEGRLGDGSNIVQARAPVQVEALGTSVAQVAAGSRHTCALTRDGGVWCWGSGTWAIGDGRSLTRLMPVQVRGCP